MCVYLIGQIISCFQDKLDNRTGQDLVGKVNVEILVAEGRGEKTNDIPSLVGNIQNLQVNLNKGQAVVQVRMGEGERERERERTILKLPMLFT